MLPEGGKADLLESTKKKVRALLLSAKNGLVLREFLTDYRDLIGQSFPFRDIGFPTPESCLLEMRDVVWVQQDRYGEVKLRGVADATTQHIAELVSKQKSKKTGGRSRVIAQKVKRAEMSKGRMQPIRQQSQLASPHVPPFLRTNISQLLRENPDGVLGSSFNAMYARRFGTQIDYSRLRFTNMKELLFSIKDIVNIEEMRTGNCRVFSPDMAPTNNYNQAQREPLGKYVPPALRTQQNTTGDSLNRTSRETGRAGQDPSWRHTQEENQPSQGGSRSDYGANSNDNSPKQCEKVSRGHRRHLEKPVFADGIPADVKSKLQAALQRRKAGMFSSRLQREFKDLHNEDLSFQKFGFTSMIEFVSALPDIVAIERPNPKGDWVLFDAESHNQSSQPTKTVPQKDVQSNAMITQLENQLVKLLKIHPNGLLLAMLPDLYKQTYGETLKPERYNFKSTDALLCSFADRILSLSYQGNGEIYVFSLPVNKQEQGQQTAHRQVPKPVAEPDPPMPVQPPASRPHQGHHRHIPPDAVLTGSTFIKQRIPQSSEYLEVFVSNVNHPGKIWIQLKGTTTTDSLEELMDRLEEIYCGNQCELYQMPEDYVMVGMPCAVVFPEDQNWHRCTVSAVPENQEIVEVYYVDYGNSCRVHKSGIYFLKSKFMKLPAQAIEARLANIAMANGKFWTEASKNFLLKCVANKALCAYITEIMYDNLSLCLCDTNGKEDVHINDLLIEECHAMFQPDNMPQEVFNELEDDITYAGIDAASTPAMEALTDDMEAMDMEAGRRYVKFVRLNIMYDVHLVNYNNTAYLPGTEIAAFFWETNKLRAMLRTKRLNIPSKVVCQEDDPDLFEEFRSFQVKGLIEDGELKPYTTIYELSSVPLILEALKHPSSELKNSIQDLIEKFDPEDAFWRGDEIDVSNDDTENDITFDLSLEDLNLMLKAMQFRRRRLLQNMACAFSETTVDEVNEVEIQINALQEKMKSVSGGKDLKKQQSTTAHIVRAESDEFIQSSLDNFQAGGDAKPQVQVTKACINRVTPFMDTSMTTSSGMATAAPGCQVTRAGTAAAAAAATATQAGFGLPVPGQVGMGFPGLGMPMSTAGGTYNLPGVTQAGMQGMPLLPLNQGLLSTQQQQQILAMASVLQAQGAMLSQPGMPAMGPARGATPFMFQPMMGMPGMPGMPNLMLPPMQPLGRGQPNIIPGHPFNPGAKPPQGK